MIKIKAPSGKVTAPHRQSDKIGCERLHQTLKALEASQSAYFDLCDTAPFGYMTLSEQGLILQANLAAAAVLGVEQDALIMQQLSAYIFMKSRSTCSRNQQQFIESDTPQVCEFRIQKKQDIQK